MAWDLLKPMHILKLYYQHGKECWGPGDHREIRSVWEKLFQWLLYRRLVCAVRLNVIRWSHVKSGEVEELVA